MIENSHDSIVFADAEGVIRYQSPASIEIAGYASGERVGHSALDHVHPADLDAVHHAWTEMLRHPDAVHDVEYRLRRKDGTWCWLQMSIRNLLGNPSIQSVVLTSRDVTKRKEAETERDRSQQLLAKAFLCNPASLSLCDLTDHLRILSVNEAFEQRYGYTREEAVGHTVKELGLWADTKECARVFQRIQVEGQVRAHEFRYCTRNGEFGTALLSGDVIYLDGKACALTASINITDRKRAEEELRQSEARFRSYFELPLVGFGITSPEKRWIVVNDRLCEILGYSREELSHMDWAEITHPDDLPECVRVHSRLLAGEIDRYSLEKRYLRKDGTAVWVDLAVGCVRKPDGKADLICSNVQDITDRKRAETALRKAEEEYRTIFERATEGIFRSSPEGKYLTVNPAWAKVLGYDSPEDLVSSVTIWGGKCGLIRRIVSDISGNWKKTG